MALMGGGVGNGGGGLRRRRRARGRAAPVAEINMTPFIDVMLVLLIIFMVTAPLLTAGVPVDLPRAAAQPINVERQPVTLTVDAAGALFIGERRIPLADLPAVLRAAAPAGAEERIYVRGARTAPYGAVAQVMAAVTQAGFRRVALVTEQEGR